MKYFFYTIWEIVEVALIAIFAVLIIRYFLVQPFLVNGASMEPNFHGGDYLIVDELTYRFKEPERGEVIVFKYPGNESYYYIKRIIGLPGETIDIKNGKVEITNNQNSNGFVLDEAYLPSGLITSSQKEKFVLNKDEYFVLGDNRDFSFDSRGWGILKKEKIIGLVRLRLWPFTSISAFEKPSYQY